MCCGCPHPPPPLSFFFVLSWLSPPFPARFFFATLPHGRRQDLQQQTGRITRTRQQLYDALKARDPHRDWSHIVKQQGMFSYTGLTPEQCDKLVKEHHFYLLSTGRINVSGITASSVERFAEAVVSVCGAAPPGGATKRMDSEQPPLPKY